MRNVWTIARKELKAYFASPIAYTVLAIFGFIFGWMYFSSVAIFVDFSSQAQMGRPGMPPMNLNEFVIRPLLGNMGIVSLFLAPLITMRLFAEEKRSGTFELLLTSPVRDFEIILGKWLGGMLLFGCMVLVSLVNIGLLFAFSAPDWKALAVGYLGVLLMGGVFLALGAFISTTTSNQIVAGAVTFGVFLLLWILDWATAFSTSGVGKLAQFIAIMPHFEQFSKGVIELKNVVYYISAIALGFFLTKRSLESLRWRA